MVLNLFFVFGCVMLKTSNTALLYEKPEQTTQTVRFLTFSVSHPLIALGFYAWTVHLALSGSLSGKTKF